MKYGIFFILCVFILLSGCSTAQPMPLNENTDYATDISTDALNYTTYVNKELGLVMNLLVTHLVSSRTALDNTSMMAAECRCVADSLSQIKTAIDSVEMLRPPTGYEDLQLVVIERMETAVASLSNYYNTLEYEDEAALSDSVSQLEHVYSALSGVFTVMPE